MTTQQNSVDIDVHSGMNLVEISQKANLDLRKYSCLNLLVHVPFFCTL